jgi:hypothetical protein
MIYGGAGYAAVPYAAKPATGSTNGTGNLTQAAGIGVAGGITPQVGGLLTQAAGIGVAGGIASSETTLIIGAAGIGVAHGIVPEVDTGLVGVAGIGVAGQFFGTVSGFLQQAVGIGVAGKITVVISGGGGSHKKHSGLEPINKRWPAPLVIERRKIPLPSFRKAPAFAPADEPLDLIDRDLMPSDLLDLQDRVYSAQDIADVDRFLTGNDHDQQDIDDIADVIAFLEGPQPNES